MPLVIPAGIVERVSGRVERVGQRVVMAIDRRSAGALLGALCLGGRPVVAAAAPAGPRAVALVTAFIAAWNERDESALSALFVPAAAMRVATSQDAPIVIEGMARVRTWLLALSTFDPRIWNAVVELPDGRLRWSVLFSSLQALAGEEHYQPLLMEAALAPDGRMAVLCAGVSEGGLAAAWSSLPGKTEASPVERHAPAGAASVSHGPLVRIGPAEGDYRSIMAGGLLAAGAFLLARRRVR